MNLTAIATSQVPSSTANSIQVMKVCQALVQSGHSLQLLVPGSESSDWEPLTDAYGLSTRFVVRWLPTDPRWKRNDFVWKAVQVAKKGASQGIYTWAVQSAVFALQAGLPTLLELHDLPTGRLGPLWLSAFLRQPGRKRLVLITRALKSAIERHYGRLPEKDTFIAPNGVDLERYQNLPSAAEARIQLGLPDMLTVGCSGHLYAGRGSELFLALAERFPQVHFLWMGGRPEDVRVCQEKARQAGLSQVTFTGFIPNVRLPLYQAASDILLMPYGSSIAGSSGGNSADICSPMKLFDYLAAGRAILTSDLPVIHEVLNDTQAAFAPPDDLPAWTAALTRLVDDGPYRERLAGQAHQLASQYTWLEREKNILAGWETPSALIHG